MDEKSNEGQSRHGLGSVRVLSQFRGPILGIILGLLFSDPTKIPEAHASIATGASKDGFLKGMPCYGRNPICMPNEGMYLDIEVPQIPNADRVIP